MMNQPITTKNSNIISGLALVAVCVGAFYTIRLNNQEKIKRDNAWKTVACPSLLSIGRSSRDTLIIMKNSPLCNEFVIENLQ